MQFGNCSQATSGDVRLQNLPNTHAEVLLTARQEWEDAALGFVLFRATKRLAQAGTPTRTLTDCFPTFFLLCNPLFHCLIIQRLTAQSDSLAPEYYIMSTRQLSIIFAHFLANTRVPGPLGQHICPRLYLSSPTAVDFSGQSTSALIALLNM